MAASFFVDVAFVFAIARWCFLECMNHELCTIVNNRIVIEKQAAYESSAATNTLKSRSHRSRDP